MSDMLKEALALAARGFRVVPIHTPRAGGCSCERGAACGGSAGKHPRLNAWQRDATTDPMKIRAWWRAWPDANVGIATGGAGRIVAVDIDGAEGRETLARLELAHGALPATLTSKSGRVDGGEHRFFRVPEGLDIGAIKNRAGRPGGPMPKVDIRANNGQVVAPPSLHASGNRYAWINRDAPIATLPGWLYDLATWEPPLPQAAPPARYEPSVVERARAYVGKVRGAISGQGGHSHTLLVAEHLVRGFELDDGTALMILCEWNRTCDPPWSERELRHKIHEARARGTAVAVGAHTRTDRVAPFRAQAPRVAPRPPAGDGAGLGMLGALLDVPNLFEKPEVQDRLTDLEGPIALAVAAARLDSASAVVERTPEHLRGFVSRRLDNPEHTTIEEALQWFNHYARALVRAQRKASA